MVLLETDDLVELADGTPFFAGAVVAIVLDQPPDAFLVLEVLDSKPVATALLFGPKRADGLRPPITAKALRSFSLEKAISQAVAMVAEKAWYVATMRSPGGVDKVTEGLYAQVGLRPGADNPIVRASKAAQAMSRRRVTDSLLREVAQIAQTNPVEPTKAVAAQLFTSHRNATRWITTARERGLLVDGFSGKAVTK